MAQRRLFFGNERGEGKLGCTVTLLLLVTFVYLSIKTVPIYLAKVEFDEGMSRIASQAGSTNMPSKAIAERVKALAKSGEFEVDPEDIRVTRSTSFQTVPEIKIDVDFQRRLELPGYVYVFRFNSKVSSMIGRL